MALETRFLAGCLRRRVARLVVADAVADAVAGAGAVERRAAVGQERMPRRFAWLYPLVPADAACYAGYMRVVLAEPEMQALLAACPQAVRALGPLCRMLGIERAAFVPGVLAEAAARVRAPRKRRVVEAPEDPREAHYAFTQVPRRFWLRIKRLR